jgi:hypothetical protein
MTPRFLLLLMLAVIPSLNLWPAEGQAPAVPAAMANDWHQTPEAARKAADAQAGTTAATAPEPGGFWAQAAGWAVGAVGLAITMGKFVPGIGGAIAQIAGPIYDAVVSKNVRQAEQRQQALAGGFETVLHLIDRMPPDTPIAELKKKLAQRLPNEARDAVNEWLVSREVANLHSRPVATPQILQS